MLKFWFSVLVLGILASAVYADLMFPVMSWGAWSIETSDLVMTEKYPVTNMLDGAPQTAWVFNKESLAKSERWPFVHGEGEEFTVRYKGDPITIDNISIINGYAKSEAIYQRNNRILKLEVSCYAGEKGETKVYDLKETRSPQRLIIPKLTSSDFDIRLKVIQVALGDDDDLCISELALCDGDYHIPYNIPAVIIANDTNGGCCGGYDYYLLSPSGTKITLPGVPQEIVAIATLPDSGNALIWCDDFAKKTGTIYVCNMITQKLLYSHTFTSASAKKEPPTLQSERFGWIDANSALICINPLNYDWEYENWYRISLKDGFSITLIDDQKKPKFLPGLTKEPEYGA